jgi:hypothetical protein
MAQTPPTSALSMQNWYASTLSQSCGSTDTTLYITVVPSISEGYLVIDPNNTSTREVVHFTSVGSGTISIPTTGDRGLDGTSAQTHAQGTAVELHYTTSNYGRFGNVLVGGTLGVTGVSTFTGGFSNATMINPYKFSVYRTSAVNVTSSYTVLPFDTKSFDTGTNIDVVTNKGRFTAPVAGFYQFEAVAGFTGSSGNSYMILAFYKNGSGIYFGSAAGTTGGLAVTRSNISALLQLSANDYVEVYMEANGTAALQVGDATVNGFQGFLVSAT